MQYTVWDAPQDARKMASQMLWNMIPAFANTKEPITIVNASHPDFRESFRHFGVPSAHACRLEKTISTLKNVTSAWKGWTITLRKIQPLELHKRYVYTIQNTATGEFLFHTGTQTGLASLNEYEQDKNTWVICPRVSGLMRGWEIYTTKEPIHKLVVSNETDLKLCPVISFALQTGLGILPDGLQDTFWDFCQPAAFQSKHKAHFWMPWFFSSLSQKYTDDPSMVGLGPYENNFASENSASAVLYKDAVLKYGPDAKVCGNLLEKLSRVQVFGCRVSLQLTCCQPKLPTQLQHRKGGVGH